MEPKVTQISKVCSQFQWKRMSKLELGPETEIIQNLKTSLSSIFSSDYYHSAFLRDVRMERQSRSRVWARYIISRTFLKQSFPEINVRKERDKKMITRSWRMGLKEKKCGVWTDDVSSFRRLVVSSTRCFIDWSFRCISVLFFPSKTLH